MGNSKFKRNRSKCLLVHMTLVNLSQKGQYKLTKKIKVNFDLGYTFSRWSFNQECVGFYTMFKVKARRSMEQNRRYRGENHINTVTSYLTKTLNNCIGEKRASLTNDNGKTGNPYALG